MKTPTPSLLSASSLSSDNVYNRQDEKLGSVKDFMLDLSTGNIAYAVLSFGGFLGVGDKLFAVPWEALDVDTENKRFVADISEEHLEDAPGFDKDNWPSQPDREFVNRVYAHYGREPYYDESGAVRRREPRTVGGATRFTSNVM